MPFYKDAPCLRHEWTTWMNMARGAEVRVCMKCYKWEQRDCNSSLSSIKEVK